MGVCYMHRCSMQDDESGDRFCPVCRAEDERSARTSRVVGEAIIFISGIILVVVFTYTVLGVTAR